MGSSSVRKREGGGISDRFPRASDWPGKTERSQAVATFLGGPRYDGSMENPRTVFLGTPAFALPVLQALEGLGWPVIGVYTTPDRPAGRGRAVAASAVGRYARERGLQVRSPETTRGPEFVAGLRERNMG